MVRIARQGQAGQTSHANLTLTGRPLLAALATSRSRERIPGRGFYCLIAALGLYDGPDDGPQAREYHQDEVEMAWAYWGDGPCEDCTCREASD